MAPTRSLLALGLTAVASFGCTSTYGKQYRATTTLLPAAAFDCVTGKVNELGYQVTDANREAGLVKARSAQPAGMKLDGTPFFDEVTVSITSGSPATLYVTATERKHADAIFSACSSSAR